MSLRFLLKKLPLLTLIFVSNVSLCQEFSDDFHILYNFDTIKIYDENNNLKSDEKDKFTIKIYPFLKKIEHYTGDVLKVTFPILSRLNHEKTGDWSYFIDCCHYLFTETGCSVYQYDIKERYIFTLENDIPEVDKSKQFVVISPSAYLKNNLSLEGSYTAKLYKGDSGAVMKIKGDNVYIVYLNEKLEILGGWLKKSEIKITN